ncbi:DUF4132 domain-containing protein [Actinomadura sp. 9N407]|uniref:DUF4132 domain-containing protein n=1 Tax=Actinomadura sp. 9N407 TaxID=3375154 RepID=UPI00378962DF
MDRSAGAAMRERFGELEASEPLAERDDVDTEMAEAARDFLAGGANARGAAVVAALLAQKTSNWDLEKFAVPLTDSWVAEHGVPFAACVFAELSQFVWDDDGIGIMDEHGSSRGHTSTTRSKLMTAATRLRALLAAGTDEDYQEAVDRLAGCRRTAAQRVVVSFLVPTRHDWVRECCAAPPPPGHQPHFWWMLYCSLGSAEHVDLITGTTPSGYRILFWAWTRPIMLTMVDGAGAAIAPLLIQAFDVSRETVITKTVPEILAVLPTDEAFQALVDRADRKGVLPALRTATKRFPVRALRLLAPVAAGTPKFAELLAEHVRIHRDLVLEVLPGLPAEVAEVVGPLVADGGMLPDAPADVLPRLLVDPPWLRTAKPPKPAVVAGLTPPGESAMKWAPGERERWAQTHMRFLRLKWEDPDGPIDWDEEIEPFLPGGFRSVSRQPEILIHGPEDKVRPLLADWRPLETAYRPDLAYIQREAMPVVARFGLDALPGVLSRVEDAPVYFAVLLLPFLDAQAARLVAGSLARRKTRKAALDWLERHGLAAVPMLVPAAVGKPGVQRREAESALRLLADGHGDEKVVQAAARSYGSEAAGAVEAMLAADPLELVPKRVPDVGEWADVRALPQVRLRGRDDALPAEAARHLLTMLAMSKIDQVYPGVEVVKEVCDRESLAAFGWEVFQQWRQHGAPSKDGWALAQLGSLGDDETVRRLTPLIRAWPGDGGHAKAVTGLDILARIGTDVALMHLYGIAQKVKFTGLKTRAQAKIQDVADSLDLTSEQLGDRLVPDFGLDAAGGLVLDYGPRRFLIGFDEALKPFVADEDGARRKALPKPGAKDDPELAPAAYKRFSALKKDVRTVAADQIRRMEAAMIGQRRWSVGDFRRLFVAHPLIGHIARRLVWIAEDGGKTTAFRVAEDRTFADAADDVLTVPESAVIGIPHPVRLGDTLDTWTTVFADYLILQPFPQLGRTVHTLTDTERAGHRLDRFQGAGASGQAILGLERFGWQRTAPMDAGLQHALYREVPGGMYINISLDPPVSIGDLEGAELKEIWLENDSASNYAPEPYRPRPFGDLDPVTASEVISELTDATR